MIKLTHSTPIFVQPQQYDCTMGRFLSLDPLMDKFPEMSPYSYANNNPISFKDPTGLEPEGEKGKDEVQAKLDVTEFEYEKMSYLAFIVETQIRMYQIMKILLNGWCQN
jgi:hypothetical protein